MSGSVSPTTLTSPKLILLALVDLEGDLEAVLVALDLRLVDAHVDVAVLVVEGGEALGVGVQHLAVEVAGAGDEGEDPALLRRHEALQLAVAELLVALEDDLADADRLVLVDDEGDVDLVLAHRRGLVVDVGVEVALLLVGVLGFLDAACAPFPDRGWCWGGCAASPPAPPSRSSCCPRRAPGGRTAARARRS